MIRNHREGVLGSSDVVSVGDLLLLRVSAVLVVDENVLLAIPNLLIRLHGQVVGFGVEELLW